MKSHPPRWRAMVISFALLAGLLPVAAAEPSSGLDAFNSHSFTLHANQAKWTYPFGYSTYHAVEFIMQGDGNLVMYEVWLLGGIQRTARWHTSTYGNRGARAVMQTDGNLVVYGPAPANQVLFQTQTYGNNNAELVMAGDQKLRIFGNNSQVLWDSGVTSRATSGTGSDASFNGRKLDSSTLTHASSETTQSHKDDWQWRWDGVGGENVYEPTNLTFTKISSPGTAKVYWYQTPSIPAGGADAFCTQQLAGNKCGRWRIRFTNQLAGATHNQKNNAVCHELAHTVGFEDGGNNQASCITGGEDSRLRSWERSKINGEY